VDSLSRAFGLPTWIGTIEHTGLKRVGDSFVDFRWIAWLTSSTRENIVFEDLHSSLREATFLCCLLHHGFARPHIGFRFDDPIDAALNRILLQRGQRPGAEFFCVLRVFAFCVGDKSPTHEDRLVTSSWGQGQLEHAVLKIGSIRAQGRDTPDANVLYRTVACCQIRQDITSTSAQGSTWRKTALDRVLPELERLHDAI